MQSRGFLPVIFNILIPALILSKGGRFFDPVTTVLVALSLPLMYGLYEIIKHRKLEFLSVLGLVNVGVNGYLTLQQKGGLWFACKEAMLPLMFALYFGLRKQNFIRELLGQPHLLKWSLIHKRLEAEPQLQKPFDDIFGNHRHRITAAFLISALLNFLLGLYIFAPLPESMASVEKSATLNSQLGHMTGLALFIVALPCSVIMMWTFFSVLRAMGRLFGVPWKQLLES